MPANRKNPGAAWKKLLILPLLCRHDRQLPESRPDAVPPLFAQWRQMRSYCARETPSDPHRRETGLSRRCPAIFDKPLHSLADRRFSLHIHQNRIPADLHKHLLKSPGTKSRPFARNGIGDYATLHPVTPIYAFFKFPSVFPCRIKYTKIFIFS